MDIEKAQSVLKALKSKQYLMCMVDFDIEGINATDVPYNIAVAGVILSIVQTNNGPEFREVTTKGRFMTYSKQIGSKTREDTLAKALAKRYADIKLKAAGKDEVNKLIKKALGGKLSDYTDTNKRQLSAVLSRAVYKLVGHREIPESTPATQDTSIPDNKESNDEDTDYTLNNESTNIEEEIVEKEDISIEEMPEAEESQEIEASQEIDVEADEETTPADEETTPADEETTPADEETTPADEETTPADEFMGTVGVEKVVENYTECGKLDSEINELRHLAKEAGYGCEACNYTGWQFTTLGLKVKCSCQDRAKYNKEPPKQKLDVKAIVKDGELAVINHIIPEERRYDEFDPDYSKRQASIVARSCGCNIVNFDQVYIPTLNEIMGKLMTGTLKQSYIIGAPNGFGKTTFVMTCLKRLHNMGKKVVPYKSLRELAEIQEDDNNRVMRRLAYARRGKNADIEEPKYKKLPFNWRDYMEADVLFTFLTTSENRWIESSTLKGIIEERSVWGRPTIVMTSSSVKLYTSDRELKKNFWDDILAYGGMQGSNDRLIHRSCFKQYKSAIVAKAGEDY